MAPTDVLHDEARQMRREAWAKRRAFSQGPGGSLARQLRGAMREYERMRGEGVEREDAEKGLVEVFRDVFPLTKFQPKCDVCADTGWEECMCSFPRRCGRRKCGELEAAYEHLYVEPCICPSGDKYRARLKAVEDAAIAAGRTKRKRGSFTRLGA